MPGRPSREWMRDCIEGVSAGRAAVDPGAVCGATWQRKPSGERAAIARSEEGPTMASKKKKAKKKKHGGAHAGAHHPKRSKAKKHKKQHRCLFCGHAARHDAKAGCLHNVDGKFCTCKHR